MPKGQIGVAFNHNNYEKNTHNSSASTRNAGNKKWIQKILSRKYGD
jgi:hypothetical protein